MIDTEHDSLNWKLIFNLIFIATLGGIWWWSVFTKGLGVTIIWTIVFIAIIGLFYTMKDFIDHA